MEDFDFDKIFSDKMRQSGAPDLSAADWHQLSGRLEEFDRKRLRVFPMWWLMALTGLLLLSNLGWWMAWHNTSKKQDQLVAEWQQTRQQNIVQQDTVVKRTIVYVYDTIRMPVKGNASNFTNNYQKELGSQSFVKKSIVQSSGNNVNADQSFAKSSVARMSGDDTNNSQLFTQKTVSQGSGNFVDENKHTGLSAANSMTDKRDEQGNKGEEATLIKQIPNLNLPASLIRKTPRLVIQPITDLPQIVKKAPNVSSHRHPTFGVTASSMHALSPSIILSGGLATGVIGEIPVTERIGMIFHADYAGIRLRGYTLDPSLGLPTPHSPGSEFDFKYFETHDGTKPVLSLGAGTRYWLLPDKMFSPFLGLGYVAQWHPEYSIEMEFINRNSGLEKSKDIEVDDEGKPISMLDLNIGGRFSLTQHLQLQAGGYYQMKINPERRGIPRYIGLKAAFLYEL